MSFRQALVTARIRLTLNGDILTKLATLLDHQSISYACWCMGQDPSSSHVLAHTHRPVDRSDGFRPVIESLSRSSSFTPEMPISCSHIERSCVRILGSSRIDAPRLLRYNLTSVVIC